MVRPDRGQFSDVHAGVGDEYLVVGAKVATLPNLVFVIVGDFLCGAGTNDGSLGHTTICEREESDG